MVSKRRDYKNNNRTRNLPLNFSPLTGDCASDFGQFISNNNNNWYKLPTGQGMISHFVDLYELADQHVGIQMSELDRVLCLEPPTREEQIVKFVKDGTNTNNIKLKPDDVETVTCTCVATSFLCIDGVLKLLHESGDLRCPAASMVSSNLSRVGSVLVCLVTKPQGGTMTKTKVRRDLFPRQWSRLWVPPRWYRQRRWLIVHHPLLEFHRLC
jgi:hypothetical protein